MFHQFVYHAFFIVWKTDSVTSKYCMKKERKKNMHISSLTYTVDTYSLILSSQHHNSTNAINISHKAIDGIVDDNVSTGDRDKDGDDNDMIVAMYLDERR